MSGETVSFVRATVERFPIFEELLQTHMNDNFGEILPNVFLGELTRYVVDLASNPQDDSGDDKELRVSEVLRYLENQFVQGGDEIQELISVSFLENLPRQGTPGHEIRNLVGPNMRNQLRKIG